jgi:putative transposase
VPQSLVQNYLHIVFSTKDRRPFIQDRAIRDEVHRFLGGECNKLEWPVLRVGGVADLADFYWQQGYGAFSVSPGHIAGLIDYINNQEEHHKNETFQDEFRRLFTKYGIEWDERFVWD